MTTLHTVMIKLRDDQILKTCLLYASILVTTARRGVRPGMFHSSLPARVRYCFSSTTAVTNINGYLKIIMSRSLDKTNTVFLHVWQYMHVLYNIKYVQCTTLKPPDKFDCKIAHSSYIEIRKWYPTALRGRRQ